MKVIKILLFLIICLCFLNLISSVNINKKNLKLRSDDEHDSEEEHENEKSEKIENKPQIKTQEKHKKSNKAEIYIEKIIDVKEEKNKSLNMKKSDMKNRQPPDAGSILTPAGNFSTSSNHTVLAELNKTDLIQVINHLNNSSQNISMPVQNTIIVKENKTEQISQPNNLSSNTSSITRSFISTPTHNITPKIIEHLEKQTNSSQNSPNISSLPVNKKLSSSFNLHGIDSVNLNHSFYLPGQNRSEYLQMKPFIDPSKIKQINLLNQPQTLPKRMNLHGIESREISLLNPMSPTQMISPISKVALTISPKPCATPFLIQPAPMLTQVVSTQTISPNQPTVILQKNLRGGNLMPLTAVPVVNQTQQSIIVQSNPSAMPISQTNRIQINAVQNRNLSALTNLNPQPALINNTPTHRVITSHRIIQPLGVPLVSRISNPYPTLLA
jgi:sortase (surface protein transpeptidase)